MFSKLTISDLLVFSGLVLMAAGLWPWLGALVLVGLGVLFLAAGLWTAWPRKGR